MLFIIMPKRCIFGCPYDANVSVHRFPNPVKYPDQFKAWVQKTGGKLDTQEDIDFYSKKVVCDVHFTEQDKNRNQRVNHLSVPSLYLSNKADEVHIRKQVTFAPESRVIDCKPTTSAMTDKADEVQFSKEVTFAPEPRIIDCTPTTSAMTGTMPRNYIRKTSWQNWNQNSMINALDAVRAGMAYKTASKTFSVPVMALKRRAKGKNVRAVGAAKVMGNFMKTFTEEQEQELLQHIFDNEETMYGFTADDILKFAYNVAEKNNIKHPFSSTKCKAGKDWLRGFRRRHPCLTLRAPESTSAARARAFNKPIVGKFFSILKNVQEKHAYPAHRIFNVDETSLNTVPTKNTKILAKRGRKQVARITSAERGESTTAVICGSAGGNFIPPMLIFRRLRMKMELMDGAPPGSIYACNPSGWMNIEVFSQWFDHFLAHAKPSAEDPVLLILDGHLSHTRNLDVIIKARENNVTIVCLPPHCTHKLQPLDVAVMYPLSTYHNQALEKWMNHNPGRVVSVFQISKVFGEAYLKAAVPLNIIKGFQKCGIMPLDPDVFTDVDFVAANTTNQEKDGESVEIPPLINTVPDAIPAPSVEDVENNLTTDPFINSNPDTIPVPPGESVDDISPSRAAVVQPLSGSSSPSILQICENEIAAITPPRDDLSLAVAVESLVPAESDKVQGYTSPIASTSFNIPPRVIQPLPKMEGKRSKTKRGSNSAAILTSTPYKTKLEEEMDRKNKKEILKQTRINQKNAKKTKENTSKEKSLGKENIKKKSRGKGKEPKPKRKRREMSESSSDADDEDDTECIFCNENYTKDNRGEGWIRCIICLKWGHDACAGIDPDDADEFTCDFCRDDRFGVVRKKLHL